MYFDSLETYFIRFVISISNYNQIDFIEKKCGQKKKTVSRQMYISVLLLAYISVCF